MSDSSGSEELAQIIEDCEAVSTKSHAYDNERALVNSMPPLPPYHPNPQK